MAGELTIILPAYNEAATVGSVIGDLLQEGDARQWAVIVVDDGSVDGTAAVLARYGQAPNVQIVSHSTNRGYGAALKTGIRAATTPWVATMDADGQHDPTDLVQLMDAAKHADMLIGKRIEMAGSPMWRRPGKFLLGLIANYLARRRLPDINSGLRVVRREVISRYLHLLPDGFSFSLTSTLVLLNRGYAVAFHPIRARPRVGRSTVSLMTGFETLLLIARLIMLLDPLRIFLPLSGVSLALAVVWGLPYVLGGRGVSVGALLFGLNGVLTFLVGLLADQIALLRKEKYE